MIWRFVPRHKLDMCKNSAGMGIKMVNRDDMLELTRRMTPARASIDRIAGAYFDEEGYVDGTFNTHFLKLSASDREKLRTCESRADLKDK